MSSKVPKRHHYVPQLYLSGFTDANNTPNQLWVYQNGKKPFLSNIKDVAVVTHLYSDSLPDGSRNPQRESDLAKQVDGPGSRVIRKIIRGYKLNDVDRARFAKYMCYQMNRTLRALDFLKQVQPQVTREIIEEWPSAWRPLVENAIAKRQPGLADEMFRQLLNDRQWRLFYEMRWQYLVSYTGGWYCTNDNPIYLFGGLGYSNSEMAFPISKDVVLWATWHHELEEGKYVQVNNSIVDEINRRTVAHAFEYVYHAKNDVSLQALVDAPQQPQAQLFPLVYAAKAP